MNILKAVLGWSNPDSHGGNNMRLYALDRGDSPRWARQGGRTAERAIIEAGGGEGDRYLIVPIGNRFVSEDRMERIMMAIDEMIGDGNGQSMEHGNPTPPSP